MYNIIAVGLTTTFRELQIQVDLNLPMMDSESPLDDHMSLEVG